VNYQNGPYNILCPPLEQLADHNYEYWTSFADRERRQNQEEVLSVADEDFKADAQKRRDVIMRDLNEAIDNADRLKAECEPLGIDINHQRRNIWDLEDEELREAEIKARAEYREAFDAALAIVPLGAFENAELVLATPSDHGSEQLNLFASSERTESWVKTLAQEQYHNKEIDEGKGL
jgi:sugar diacid utilization regulator